MKIGSPKNLEGKNLLVGVSAVDGNGNAIGSDITTLKKGANVTFASSANGVLVIAAESVASVENATSAIYATNDKNGNDIATTYQTVINDGNKLSGAYVSGAVASATTAANVMNSVIKMQLNGVAVDSFTLNQGTSKVINYAGVAMTSDLTAYATSLDLTMDTTAYVVSAVLKNGTTVLTSKTIDLPLETMVVGADYDSANKSIALTLKNGTVTSFSVSDLINGLVPDTRKVNGKALSNDITLYGSDILTSANGDSIVKKLSDIQSSVSDITTNIGSMGGGDMMKAEYVTGDGVVNAARKDGNGNIIDSTYQTKITADTKLNANLISGEVSSATNATNDGNGNNIVNTYQTKISTTNKVSANCIDGIVSFASNATTVNGHTVSADVPANAVFTDTIPGSAVITIKAGNVEVGSFNANASTATSVNIPVATDSVYGVVKSSDFAPASHDHLSDTWFTNIADMFDNAVSGVIKAPDKTGNAGKVLALNSMANGYEWIDIQNSVNATVADSAVRDGVGNVIATYYQPKIDATNKIDGSMISGTVTSATNATTAANVHDGEITIQLNGTSKGSFTTNQSTTSSININGVALSSDLTGYANALDFTIDNNTYVISAVLKNGSTILTSKTIDLPLETMVVSASYDSTDKEIDLELKNGNIVSFGVGDLINGLVPDTRKVNGKALSDDVTLYGGDILVVANGISINSRMSNIESSVASITTDIGNLGGGDMMKADYVTGTSSVARAVADASGNVITDTYQTKIGAGAKISGAYISGAVESAVHATTTDSASSADSVAGANVTGTVASASNATTVNSYTVSANVPANAQFTDTLPKYNGSNVSSIVKGDNVTLSYANGALTIKADAQEVTVDDSVTSDGVNPVAGSGIYALLLTKANVEDFAQVAFTGDYNDLSNKVSVDGSVTSDGVNPVAGSAIYSSISAHSGNTAIHVPSATIANNGKVLKVVDGVPAWSNDLTADGSAVLPAYGSADKNKVLVVNETGTGTTWSNLPSEVTSQTVSEWGYTKVTSANVSAIASTIASNAVSSNVKDATISFTQGNEAIGSFTLNQASNKTIDIPAPSNAIVSFTQGGASKGSFTLNQAGATTIALDAGGELDSAITESGTNAVTGSAIYSSLLVKADIEDLAQVAFTGDYNDLLNKPSETGGGSITIAGTVTSTETNAVAGSAVYNYVFSQMGNISALLAAL